MKPGGAPKLQLFCVFVLSTMGGLSSSFTCFRCQCIVRDSVKYGTVGVPHFSPRSPPPLTMPLLPLMRLDPFCFSNLLEATLQLEMCDIEVLFKR